MRFVQGFPMAASAIAIERADAGRRLLLGYTRDKLDSFPTAELVQSLYDKIAKSVKAGEL